MAYDVDLAARVRALLPTDVVFTEQALFGGLAFLRGGHMAVAASGHGGLLVRCDPAEAERLMAASAAEPMEMRGRPMRGWLQVPVESLRTEAELARWVEVGVTAAGALPPKAPAP